MNRPAVNTDDWLRLVIYEGLRHQASAAFHDATDPVEVRLFEIEYQRYDDLIRMIKETV